MTKDIETIKNKIKLFPELPGIYKMLDSGRNIIYVGKSKCLKKRVQSYFVESNKWYKIQQMVSMINDIEYIVTDTHLEARLLECELIKTLSPHFNAQMKNDRRYIYIKVEDYNHYHPISVSSVREKNCFGPFRSRFAMEEFLGTLENLYPIIRSNNGYDFEYHLFPTSMDEETYKRNREVLLEIFMEDDNLLKIINSLQAKLEEAASTYRYEIASIYRDLMKDFMYLKYGLEGYKSLSSRNILLKLPVIGGYKVFLVSGGRIIASRKLPELTEELIHDFVYQNKAMPPSLESKTWDEKSLIDYRDILYSEISSLPEDMVVFLDSNIATDL